MADLHSGDGLASLLKRFVYGRCRHISDWIRLQCYNEFALYFFEGVSGREIPRWFDRGIAGIIFIRNITDYSEFLVCAQLEINDESIHSSALHYPSLPR